MKVWDSPNQNFDVDIRPFGSVMWALGRLVHQVLIMTCQFSGTLRALEPPEDAMESTGQEV